MYNLMRPHLKIVGKGIQSLIVQDGVAYEHGSRKVVGKVGDLAKKLAANGAQLCTHCGGTFPEKHQLEAHYFHQHRDVLLAAASKFAPKKIKGTWAPDEPMLRAEAAKLAGLDAPTEPTEGGDEIEGDVPQEEPHREPA